MRANISDVVKLIYRLAEESEETAAEVLAAFEAEKGEPSEAMEAVFQLADLFRKEKAAAGATT